MPYILRVRLLYDAAGEAILVKIAVELERALRRRELNGTPGQAAPRIVARGDGWTVADVVCTSGPEDRPFEEQHTHYAIAVVVAGTFQYRSPLGGGVMTPGGLMLGNPGQCYECGHDHGRGDRCVAFWYTPAYFERLTGVTPHQFIMRARLREADIGADFSSEEFEYVAHKVAIAAIKFADLSNFRTSDYVFDLARFFALCVLVAPSHALEVFISFQADDFGTSA